MKKIFILIMLGMVSSLTFAQMQMNMPMPKTKATAPKAVKPVAKKESAKTVNTTQAAQSFAHFTGKIGVDLPVFIRAHIDRRLRGRAHHDLALFEH